MCRASSFFSMSSDAQFDNGAIQDTRILTGSAFAAPCARSETLQRGRSARIVLAASFPPKMPADAYDSGFYG